MINIFQIFYDKHSQIKKHPEFFGLDNTDNLRPDWREYWTIRAWYKNNQMIEGDYYGFFSPKFFEKTQLSGDKVKKFIEHNSNYDVISFSPFIDQSALFFNIFQQGEYNHPGLLSLTDEVVKLFFSDHNSVSEFINSHDKFIYSNFFVAKKNFWDRWHQIMNEVFNIAEKNSTELAFELNAVTTYRDGQQVASKVFLMERVASLVLNIFPEFTVKSYPAFELPTFGSKVSKLPADLALANALKLAYVSTGDVIYLNLFAQIRDQALQKASVL